MMNCFALVRFTPDPLSYGASTWPRRDTHRQLFAIAHSPGKFRVHRLAHAAAGSVRIRRGTLRDVEHPPDLCSCRYLGEVPEWRGGTFANARGLSRTQP